MFAAIILAILFLALLVGIALVIFGKPETGVKGFGAITAVVALVLGLIIAGFQMKPGHLPP